MPASRDVFRDVSAEEVHQATAEHWDLSAPFPVPRGQWLSCPVCSSTRVLGRTWTRHVRITHTVTGRVDVSFKCCSCAAVWVHGVVVPDDYATRFRRRINEQIDRREVAATNEKYRAHEETHQP